MKEKACAKSTETRQTDDKQNVQRVDNQSAQKGGNQNAQKGDNPRANTTGSSSSVPTPAVLICIGMAGSGKTTFMQRLNAELHADGETPYVINLDPAVLELPYEANIDIRDTINYKEVMKQYKLGPNGGILTCLNLFTTKFNQVLELVEKRSEPYLLIDTPGQIEIFTWSASGTIITDALAASYPTVILYVIDTPRCTRPATFMSNMLYACSIMYKTRLPMLVVFNKIDEQDASFALGWMEDVLAFQESLQSDESYMSTLVQSMSLVLEEFYKTLRCASVSALTGQGMDEFFVKLNECTAEYWQEYRPELERKGVEMKERVKNDGNTRDCGCDCDCDCDCTCGDCDASKCGAKNADLARLLSDLQLGHANKQ